ncbi:MAG TPA: amidohydrolase family protein [Geminicoccaceae bacterium]|nr:amidohydrolase family protein [Geminicoccaceae bacterium]
MPDFAIIDSHVHLYDPGRIRYGWMRGTKLEAPHLLPDLDAARGAVEIAGIVWIEVGADPGQHEQEASMIAGLAGEPRLMGMVAAAPLEHGDAVKADLEKLAALPAVKGIRRLLQGEADPEFCLRPRFVEGVKLLPQFGLSFDLCVYHHQLYNVIELVRRCPEVRFILDHIGKPAIRDGRLDPWRADIERLAALPNVWCKLSGVVTEADHAAWTREQLRPYIRHAAERFGFERLLFGSDWPVSSLTHGYGEWVDIVDWALADCGEDERRKLFRDNAIAFYRLDAAGR